MSDWAAMQRYELNSGLHWLRSRYASVQDEYQKAKEHGQFIPPLDFYITDNGIDEPDFQRLLTHCAGKTVMEVGCGPAGCVPMWSAHVGQRILVDPLLDAYRKEAEALYHEKSWFTQDIMYFAQDAAIDIPALHGQVNGMILCRNMLDHCTAPYNVLDRLTSYAASGCRLLLWTDLYMPERDEGHVNITQSRDEFAEQVKARGWKIQRTFSIRIAPCIDFGCVAVMES